VPLAYDGTKKALSNPLGREQDQNHLIDKQTSCERMRQADIKIKGATRGGTDCRQNKITCTKDG